MDFSLPSVKVLVAQLGARRHYAVPRALGEEGQLERFFTDACGDNFPWSAAGRFLPRSWQLNSLRALIERKVQGVERERVRAFHRLYFQCRLGSLRPRRWEHRTDYWVRQNVEFGKMVCREGWGQADTVYGFNGAALEIFREAKARGLRCVLDQTAAPWRYNTRILSEEIERWPDWEAIPADIDPSGILTEREEEEWELADRVICGSEFVVQTARQVGAPVEKFRIVPYPTPHIPLAKASEERRGKDQPLRVVFVGSIQLRKGIQYLVQAGEELRSCEIRVVGPSMLTAMAQSRMAAVADVRGQVPRSEVWEQYRWADVFVLPTLSEGSANVCHEALAAGVPVITTCAAGIQARPGVTLLSSSRVLTAALSRFSSGRRLLPQSGAERSWDSYKQDLIAAL